MLLWFPLSPMPSADCRLLRKAWPAADRNPLALRSLRQADVFKSNSTKSCKETTAHREEPCIPDCRRLLQGASWAIFTGVTCPAQALPLLCAHQAPARSLAIWPACYQVTLTLTLFPDSWGLCLMTTPKSQISPCKILLFKKKIYLFYFLFIFLNFWLRWVFVASSLLRVGFL